MATRDPNKASARDRLLAASDELFYNEGIHTVGIDRVIEKAGVAKGSLYYIFGGKDQLVSAYLDGRHAQWIATVDEGIAGVSDPRERILAVFDVLGGLFSRPDYRGCAFMNATAEARADGPEMAAAGRFRSWVNDLFRDLVTAVGVVDSERLVKQLVILYDGAVTTAQMDGSAGPAMTARYMADIMLQAEGVKPAAVLV